MEADPEEGLIRDRQGLREPDYCCPGDPVSRLNGSTRRGRSSHPPERLVLAVDVNDQPAGASIMSGHVTETGQGAVRLVEWRAGCPRWVPQKVEEIIGARTVEAVSADLGGPAKQVHAELQAVCDRNLVPFIDRYPRLFGGDCARFYDDLRAGNASPRTVAPARRVGYGCCEKADRRPVGCFPTPNLRRRFPGDSCDHRQRSGCRTGRHPQTILRHLLAMLKVVM